MRPGCPRRLLRGAVQFTKANGIGFCYLLRAGVCGASQELVVVGAAGLYEARCRAHFTPHLDAQGSEQLELHPQELPL